MFESLGYIIPTIYQKEKQWKKETSNQSSK